jgi:hypothetical protein
MQTTLFYAGVSMPRSGELEDTYFSQQPHYETLFSEIDALACAGVSDSQLTFDSFAAFASFINSW